jgi:hypothetical protein
MKLINNMTTQEIMTQHPHIICSTCKTKIVKTDILVDDGISEGVYHHIGCY